jgi:hypothetical protein
VQPEEDQSRHQETAAAFARTAPRVSRRPSVLL